jgi:phosphatidylserine/phosphatidylglycerophosphate/cardiolipin synthase-like enzyme
MLASRNPVVECGAFGVSWAKTMRQMDHGQLAGDTEVDARRADDRRGNSRRAACAALAQEVHYSAEERLDAIDAKLIEASKWSIDLAAYSLTDTAVIDALYAAARRGIVIRIVFDPRERHDFVKLGDLSDNVD